MHINLKLIIAITLLLLLGLLVQCVPSSVGWRDSGEFIIAAFLLDITHPPGAPLYALFANLFTFLPLGPIAWRVHIFSAVVVVLLVFFATIVARDLTSLVKGKTTSFVLAIVTPLAFFGSEAAIKAVISAEVYALNALLFVIILACLLCFEDSKDARWLLTVCFLSGLAIGNHVVMGVVAVVCVPIAALFRERLTIMPVIIPGLILGLFGLAIYAYLPARAITNPPLNTGSPSTAERFVNHVTDARDRALRVAPMHVLQAGESEKLVSRLKEDLKRMAMELSYPVLILGAVGLLILTLENKRYGLMLIGSALANWIFFLNWDTDPWLLTYVIIALGFSYFATSVFDLFETKRVVNLIARYAFLILMFWQLKAETDFGQLKGSAAYALPAELTKNELSLIDPNAVYLHESSWFLTNYLQSIEGYRPDIKLIFQASVLFPEYFQAVRLKYKESNIFDSSNLKTSDGGNMPVDYQRMAALIDYLKHQESIFFAPSSKINHFLSAVAQCPDVGSFKLVYGEAALISADCLSYHSAILQRIKSASLSTNAPKLFKNDAINYFEIYLLSIVDLLAIKDPSLALSFFESACLPLNESFCSLSALNNLAVLYLDFKNYQKAQQILSFLVKNYPLAPVGVRDNLELANNGLNLK